MPKNAEKCETHHGLDHSSCGCPAPYRLHYFPKDPIVREEWVRRVNRQEPRGSGLIRKRWTPRQYSVLCSEHFVNGAPSKKYPVPWFKLGRKLGTPKPARRLPKRTKIQENKELNIGLNVTVKDNNVAIDEVEDTVVNEEHSTRMASQDTKSQHSVQTDHNYSFCCGCSCPGCFNKDMKIQQLQEQKQDLEVALAQKPKVIEITKKVVKTKVVHVKQNRPRDRSNPMKLLKTDKKVRFYTGLPSKAVFDLVFQYMEPKMAKVSCWRGEKEVVNKIRKKAFHRSPAKSGPLRKLQLKEEFLMVLMKLRLGLLNEDIADRFHISSGYSSRLFTTWIKCLAKEMKKAVTMPHQENIRANLPKAFKKHYKHLRGILDCTEVFIRRPRNLAVSFADLPYLHQFHALRENDV